MKSNYTIKESPSEAFFVKEKNTTVAAFHKKEHAEMFIKLLEGKYIEVSNQQTTNP